MRDLCVLSRLSGLMACLSLLCSCLLAQPGAYLDPGAWRPWKALWEKGEQAGVSYLILERGSLYLPETGLVNGLIEFDFFLHDKRALAVHFHQRHRLERQALWVRQEGERLTLSLEAFRLGRSQRLDSLHLAPKLSPDTWHHLRLAIKDQLLLVYLDDLTTPVWLCRQLQPAPEGTGIGLAVPSDRHGWVGFARFQSVALDELYLFASD